MPGLIGDVLGKGGEEAAGQAGQAVTQLNQEAIDKILAELELTQGRLAPFAEAGGRALPTLESQVGRIGKRLRPGVSGLDERLGKIFDTDVFGQLAEERGRAVQGQLSAGGLTRSGTALTEAARVPTELGLQLENLIFGRRKDVQERQLSGLSGLTGLGFGGAERQGEFGTRSAEAIARLLQATGEGQASSILTGQQARAGGLENILDIATTGAKLFKLF